jgi:Lar family restriction alleviation protein
MKLKNLTELADLKPCPFCGGEKHTICRTDYDYDNKDAYAVSCRYHNCHGSIFTLGYGYFATKDEAIAAWNTRAVDPAIIREAALREAAAVCIGVSNDILTQIGREHERWMRATAEDCSKMIFALIGEKK